MISYPNVKVNLGLSVLRRRPDGYHDLETLFVPYFGIHDTLEITPLGQWSENLCHPRQHKREGPIEDGRGPAQQDSFQTTAPAEKVEITIIRKEGVDWEPMSDLTVKAYELLDADFNLPPVKIRLEKTSPVGAGLGGGSADAAFALRMLSEMFSLDLDDKTLAGYAARLGSDCAFFVYNRPMIGTGRGEILEPYDLDLSGYELRVTVPQGIAVKTAEAYRGITPRALMATQPAPLMEALARPIEQWKDCLVNDFEATVFAAHPALEDEKRRLYEDGAVYASMSGSGSALFGLFAL